MTCDVCKVNLEGHLHNVAVIGKGSRLCMTGKNCFGWFSGYPWTLFEMGLLTTLEVMPDFPFFETLAHQWN